MGHPARHLFWILPLAALVGLSTYHQLARPECPGEILSRALTAQGLPLRTAAPLLEYVAPIQVPPSRRPPVLTLCGEGLLLPAGTQRVDVVLPPDAAPPDRVFALRGDMVGGYVERELRPAAESRRTGDGIQLQILGNAFLLAPAGDGAALSAPGAVPPAFRIELRGQVNTAGAAGSSAFFLQREPARAGNPNSLRALILTEPPRDVPDAARDSLTRAVQSITGTERGAGESIAAARARLAVLSDQEWLEQALAADAGVLAQTRDTGRAVELAILMTTLDVDGAAATFQHATGGRMQTLILFTRRGDARAVPARCRVYCFESGREIWHATLQSPDSKGLPDLLYSIVVPPPAAPAHSP